MRSLIRKVFFNNEKIKTFYITRLLAGQIEEKVILKSTRYEADITTCHGMICLDPFCVAIWLAKDQIESVDLAEPEMRFVKGGKLNASIKLSIIEQIATGNGVLLLYKIASVRNHQLSALHRLILFGWLLRSKTSTYHHRKVISALYSYPRNIIIVSFKDDQYYNIFPMDIHAHIKEDDLYILGLRTTNITLNKILEAKKVIVCDTDSVDIKTVYDLGKHSSAAPQPIQDLPFKTNRSELFGFPVPDFVGSYKEIEIIHHKKMGYHMLMVGKVVNQKQFKHDPASLYHVSFLQFQQSRYPNIEGVF